MVDLNLLETSKAKDYHEQEKTIIASIRHENIVHLHDIIEEMEGSFKFIYIIMEYCEGGSLDHFIKNKPLAEPLARRLMIQLAEALRYLESQRIIHRDLKPQVRSHSPLFYQATRKALLIVTRIFCLVRRIWKMRK